MVIKLFCVLLWWILVFFMVCSDIMFCFCSVFICWNCCLVWLKFWLFVCIDLLVEVRLLWMVVLFRCISRLFFFMCLLFFLSICRIIVCILVCRLVCFFGWIELVIIGFVVKLELFMVCMFFGDISSVG